MRPSKRLIGDLAVTASLPFATVWLYEISNALVLSAQGESVSLAMSGLIPLGVAGVSQVLPSPLTKLAQVLLSAGLMIPLIFCLSRARLAIARAFAISMAGVFVVSIYWEWFSQLSDVPASVHTGVFLAGTAGVSFALLRTFSGPRYLRARVSVLRN